MGGEEEQPPDSMLVTPSVSVTTKRRNRETQAQQAKAGCRYRRNFRKHHPRKPQVGNTPRRDDVFLLLLPGGQFWRTTEATQALVR